MFGRKRRKEKLDAEITFADATFHESDRRYRQAALKPNNEIAAKAAGDQAKSALTDLQRLTENQTDSSKRQQ